MNSTTRDFRSQRPPLRGTVLNPPRLREIDNCLSRARFARSRASVQALPRKRTGLQQRFELRLSLIRLEREFRERLWTGQSGGKSQQRVTAVRQLRLPALPLSREIGALPVQRQRRKRHLDSSRFLVATEQLPVSSTDSTFDLSLFPRTI